MILSPCKRPEISASAIFPAPMKPIVRPDSIARLYCRALKRFNLELADSFGSSVQ